MLWPPLYSFVLQLPVATLDVGKKRNRAARRRLVFGKGTKPMRGWDGLL